MKVISSIVLSTAAVHQVNALGRKLGQTKDMLAHKLNMSDEDAKKLVRGYGCFCYALSSQTVGPHFNYNGDPVDELDALCKKLFRSQKCIALDNEAGLYDKECVIDNAYQWFTDDNNNVICEEPNSTKKNPNQCKINMCELENHFTDQVAALYNSGFVQNDAYDRMDEDEYKNTCAHIPNKGKGGQDLACCGKGIERKTYNTVMNVCCNDELASPGSC